MRGMEARYGVRPDAVSYTAMLVACAQGDQLEHARNLLMEMQLHRVHPTAATHNAFINVCASTAVPGACCSKSFFFSINSHHPRFS